MPWVDFVRARVYEPKCLGCVSAPGPAAIADGPREGGWLGCEDFSWRICV